MTEFTKTKITFALAFLGTLFALHPFVEQYGQQGIAYEVQGHSIQVHHLDIFTCIAALLALSVYCYGVALLSERPASWMEKLGNYAYALALMILPLYGLLYGGYELARRFDLLAYVWVGPAALAVCGVGALVLVWRLRERLTDQDRSAQIDQLAEHEIAALNRSAELFNSQHFDLSVIEAWKAVEARLRRVLLRRGLASLQTAPQELINRAVRAGLLSDAALGLLQELRRQWAVAVGVVPLSREAADSALTAARSILATIPLSEDGKRADTSHG